MVLIKMMGLTLLCSGLLASVAAQTGSPPQDAQTEVTARLSEIQAQEEGLRTLLLRLEEEMRPENIERSLAGVGSTRPEELRENRRRTLENEKNRILAQLSALNDRRVQLQTSAAAADAAKAKISAAVLPPPPPARSVRRNRPRPKKNVVVRHRRNSVRVKRN